MALPLSKAAPLKPEIRLAQALSEFQANLTEEHKLEFRNFAHPPDIVDVARLTAEIDRETGRLRKSRRCVGPKLMNVLQSIQQYSTVADLVVEAAQSQIASAIWGAIRTVLKIASNFVSFFDQLSSLLMRVGRSSPRFQDYGELYPQSKRLQHRLCEYFINITNLCNRAVLFVKKSFLSQLSFSIINTFDSEFGPFETNLGRLAQDIRDEASVASKQIQNEEIKKNTKFRALATRFTDSASQEIHIARYLKKQKQNLRLLNSCSTYNHQTAWKQARKRGTSSWFIDREPYTEWKLEKSSCALWCTGDLGSGKTVLTASLIDDVILSGSTVLVAYFFCRYDEPESLKTRTIIGSITRQILERVSSDNLDGIIENENGNPDTEKLMQYLRQLSIPKSSMNFIIIDGLDECEESEARELLSCLNHILEFEHDYHIYCSSRSDVFRWAPALLQPKWMLSMSEANGEIERYIEETLEECLLSERLCLGDPKLVLTIRNSLVAKANNMFLWVAFQIDSLCLQMTDDAILVALEDLPKDLSETFDRILRKLHHSNDVELELCKKTFQILSVSKRPLNLEELREVLSVEVGNRDWNERNMINNINHALRCCGSLITVDEEYDTVHFTHHSIKQHLLSRVMCPDLVEFGVDLLEADLLLGDIIVTYLNMNIFDKELAKVTPVSQQQGVNYPSAILRGSLSRSSIVNKTALWWLKSRESSNHDLSNLLQKKSSETSESALQQPCQHFFLSYSQDYWLYHTKNYDETREVLYPLWVRLLDGETSNADLPMALESCRSDGGFNISLNDESIVNWLVENLHWGLMFRLFKLNSFFMKTAATFHFMQLLRAKTRDFKVQRQYLALLLYIASLENDEVSIQLLFGKGVDVNTQGGYYGNALQAASFRGNENVVRPLLEKGANVNAQGGFYGNALQAALYGGNETVVRLLLEKEANVNAQGGEFGTALQAASLNGSEATVRLLLDKEANVNAQGGRYGNALQAASYNGIEAIVRLLLEKGANVNVQGGYYGTALQAASTYGSEAIVRLLLEKKANVNAQGGYYGTALQAASDSGNEAIVRLLLDKEADVNAQSGYYGTALQAASYGGNEKIVRLLIEKGANVNAQGGEYGTALQAASTGGHKKIVRMLSFAASTNANQPN